MKKIFELTIVIGSIFLLFFFLSYSFYFEKMCINIKKDQSSDYRETIMQMGNCKSSLVCEINNVETNKKNEITNWSCEKKDFKYFEFDFYINYVVNKYFTIKEKFN